MTNYQRSEIKEKPEDIVMQKEILAKANYSLAILGMGAVYRGSGRFLNIREPEVIRRANAKSIDDAF